jgi:sugar-specific transcriptional regulator TrmB
MNNQTPRGNLPAISRLSLFFLTLSIAFASSDATYLEDSQKGESAVKSEANILFEDINILEKTKRIEILHIPESILTTRALDQEAIDKGYHHKLTIREINHLRKSFESAMRSTKATISDRNSDLRWGVMLFDAKGDRLIAIYFNSSGDRGYINSTPVSFSRNWFSENLFGWIAKNFSSDLR